MRVLRLPAAMRISIACAATSLLAACDTTPETAPEPWGDPDLVYYPAPPSLLDGCPGPCAWELDETGDERAERRAEFTYHPNGRPDRVRYLDGNGRELRVRVYEYSSDWQLTRIWTSLRDRAQETPTAGTDPHDVVLSHEHDRPELDGLREQSPDATTSASTPGVGRCESARVEHRRAVDGNLVAIEECETGAGGAIVVRRVRYANGRIRAETRYDYACWPEIAQCPRTDRLPGLALDEPTIDEAEMPTEELEDLIAPFVGRRPRRASVRWTPVDDGIRVTGLRPAPEHGLRNGDLVLELGGRTIAERFANPSDDVRYPVEMVVRRGERTVLVRLRPR